ncbi:hypothetical protein EVAR_34206_1 [Eumeta japonica]|uniref:Uncharacterized protein n=1 Tax=Eumeta variegata TaxID=151549 RepID=A0A4C1WH38_EUMVA|nr:hypothetical protein EVAR_34206_1 [Eumeta japonica]
MQAICLNDGRAEVGSLRNCCTSNAIGKPRRSELSLFMHYLGYQADMFPTTAASFLKIRGKTTRLATLTRASGRIERCLMNGASGGGRRAGFYVTAAFLPYETPYASRDTQISKQEITL